MAAKSMNDLLSPKQVARAIGVSESSLKRWCDQGKIQFEKTAGGHRRLRLNSVMTFIRDGGYELRDPGVVGLPATTGQTQWAIDRARARFGDALVSGDERMCQQVAFDLYLAGHSISVICDQLLAAAFHDVGDKWDCGDVEVYHERRGCEVAMRLIHRFSEVIPHPDSQLPRAIGGTLDGDPYTLAVGMAELVLRDTGWNAQSLGNMLPFKTVRSAVQAIQPRLVWLGVSVVRDEDRFVEEMNELFAVTESFGAVLVIGGPVLNKTLRRRIRYSTHCDSMQHLEDFSRLVLSRNDSVETK
ncbi:MAG: helix-turn-helix domain-containing protein [Planctomycetota bacterium]|nr:helix-turn-helix domain-containing protein [Planctomycetota bacterium]